MRPEVVGAEHFFRERVSSPVGAGRFENGLRF